jgi:hypothetical protein
LQRLPSQYQKLGLTMSVVRRVGRGCWWLGLALLAAGAWAPAHAGNSAVDHAEVKIFDRYAHIEVKFNVPVALRSYAPLAHGQLLQVEVELPDGAASGPAMRLGSTEWIAGSQPSANTLYEYLRFDRQAPQLGRLNIKFLRDVNYSVYKSSDSRAIVIAVLAADVPRQRVAKAAPAPQVIPQPLPAPKIVVPDVEPRPRPSTLLSPAPPAPVPDATAEPVFAPAVAVQPPQMPPPLPASDSAAIAPQPQVQARAEPLPPRRERAPAPPEKKSEGWRFYGGFSQYYRYADLKIERSGDPRFDQTTSATAESDLLSNVDFNARLRDENWDARARFAGGYLVDFLDRGPDQLSSRYRGNKALLSDAYLDVRNHRTNISAKVGRQYGGSGGVLGRFDGARLGVPLGESLRFNIVGGTPVDLTSNKTLDDTERYFYGASLDLAPQGSAWHYDAFVIQQVIDGMLDRRGIGAEVRYYAPARSLFALVDYDVDYSSLNTALLIGNWIIAKRTTLNLTVDYRNSPVLTTRNALISQPAYASIEALRETYTDSEIKRLAQDRTARSRNATLSVTQQLSADLQLYGSAGQYYFGSMPASGGVEALPGTGNEYAYELQLIASNLLAQNDTTSFGLRYYDGSLVRRSAVGVDARYLFGNFRIGPRLWVELRNNRLDDSRQWVYRPALRMEYVFRRRYHIECEASSDYYQGEIPTAGDEDIIGNFVQIGYRIDFY